MDKKETINNPNSCLNKAADNEPVFVLRAKDPQAIKTIEYWISISASQPGQKLFDARKVADAMREWRTKNS